MSKKRSNRPTGRMRRHFGWQRAGPGALALLFAVTGAAAQEVSSDTQNDASEKYLESAKDNIRIGVNPFSGESMQLYELRRQLERRQLEEQLNAPSHEEIYQKTEEIVSQLLQATRDDIQQQRSSFAAVIEDLNARINAMEASLAGIKSAAAASAGFAEPEPALDDNPASSLEQGFAAQEARPPATYLGYLDFGTGPRLIYRDNRQNLQSFAVDEYAPSAENADDDRKITAINKKGATLENGEKIILPSVRAVLSPIPVSAQSPLRQ